MVYQFSTFCEGYARQKVTIIIFLKSQAELQTCRYPTL